MGRVSQDSCTSYKGQVSNIDCGDRAERYGDVFSTVSQPPEILKASTLLDTISTNLHSLVDSHHVVLSIRDY